MALPSPFTVQEMHDLSRTEHDRQLERLLGHGNVVRRPGLLERHPVEKAQGGRRNADAAGLELPDLNEMDLVGANLLRSEFVRRSVKEFRVGADLLEIGQLRVLGEVANAHVVEHALA